MYINNNYKLKYKKRYGNIIDRLINPEKLEEFDNSNYNLFEMLELLFKVYVDLAQQYEFKFLIHIVNTCNDTIGISLDLGGFRSCIGIEHDESNGSVYIVLGDFYLPKERINLINKTHNNKSYSHNGYRIIKTLEVICKSWELSGVKVSHIVNNELAETLLSEGYIDINKSKKDCGRRDYVKHIPNNKEVHCKYRFKYKETLLKKIINGIIKK